MAMTKQPSIYIPHGGGPCFFMDWDPPQMWDQMRDYLANLPETLPEKPKAIVVISAHWEADQFTLQTQTDPKLHYDYSGFPEHTYRLNWPAKSDQDTIDQVRQTLTDFGIVFNEDQRRDYDHGVFIPLLVSWPQIDIPVMQISLKRGLDPKSHIELGKALAPLRDQGILLIGSGMSFHNLRAFFSRADSRRNASHEFDDWLLETLKTQPIDGLINWASAPGARACHPREEHLIPLMVIAGAADGDAVSRPYHEDYLGLTGVAISAFQFG